MPHSLTWALVLTLTWSPARAAERVTLDSLLRQMTDLSLLAEFPDPPYVTKQFSSYDRASEAPGKDSWFANDDRGFMLYDGIVKEKTAYYRTGPMQMRPPDGHFPAGTRVGIAPHRPAKGDYIWVYATAPDGRAVDGKIPQGYVPRKAITLDPQGHVLAEMDGPGCVVRIWSPNPADAGQVRIYLDGARAPVIDAPLEALLSGKWQTERAGTKWTPFPEPFACERSRGWNLYFPLAYAKHCKITVEKSNIYYHVDYRTYPKGTGVETFRLEQLVRHQRDRKRIAETLARREYSTKTNNESGKIHRLNAELKPGKLSKPLTIKERNQAISILSIYPGGKALKESEEAALLRSLVLIINFDGAARPQVWCPLGDFFATAPGANHYKSLPIIVRDVGRAETQLNLECLWCMPFEKSAEIQLLNLGMRDASALVFIETRPHTWNSRSMHFHAKWRTQRLKTRPFRDWTFCDLRGKGVFVGDALSVLNPVTAWWGEGDEKIYVDGEKFPSWFGTGTEDYFGYGWSDPRPFRHAYHNQTRCDGPVTKGHTSVNRFHILDAIPFEQSFRFDMEVWHWTPNIPITYTATSYWYARPGATDDFKPVDAAALAIPTLPPPYRIAGAQEGERLKVLGKSGKYDLGPQDMSELPGGKWSGDAHLWGRPPSAGAWADLELPVAKDGKYEVIVYLTKARDYGIVQFLLDGKPLGKPIDGFHAPEVIATGPIKLGTVELKKGSARLRVQVAGTNPRSVGLRFMWGLDCVRLKAVE